MTKPEDSSADTVVPEPQKSSGEQKLDPEDFYYEGSFLVFTAAYHLKLELPSLSLQITKSD
jgi:hypothetical protein